MFTLKLYRDNSCQIIEVEDVEIHRVVGDPDNRISRITYLPNRQSEEKEVLIGRDSDSDYCSAVVENMHGRTTEVIRP